MSKKVRKQASKQVSKQLSDIRTDSPYNKVIFQDVSESIMEINDSWNSMSGHLVDRYQHFGKMYRFLLQDNIHLFWMQKYSHVRNVCSYPSNCTSPYSIDCCSNLKPHTYRTRLQEPVLCACLWFYTNWLSAKMAVYRHFNIQKLYFLSTQCIYVFCVNLRTNSDYFPIQH